MKLRAVLTSTPLKSKREEIQKFSNAKLIVENLPCRKRLKYEFDVGYELKRVLESAGATLYDRQDTKNFLHHQTKLQALMQKGDERSPNGSLLR